MECKEVLKRLDDYFDGALSREEENALEEHLLKCSHCREEFEKTEALFTLLGESSQIPQNPDEQFYKTVFNKAMKQLPAAGEKLGNTGKGDYSLGEKIRRYLGGARLPLWGLQAAALVLFGFITAAIIFKTDMRTDNPDIFSQDDSMVISTMATPSPTPVITADRSDFSSDTNSGQNLYTSSSDEPSFSGENVINKGIRTNPDKRSPLLAGSFMMAERALKEVPDSLAMLKKPFEFNQTSPSVEKSAIAPGEKIMLVASPERQAEILDSLQKMKVQVYLSGDRRFIPEIHKLESFVADIAVATESPNEPYLDNLKTFQEAEQCLVDKKYLCAIQNYEAVATHNPGSLMSFLADYQTANVCFEEVKDYQAALTHYQKCLENYPSHYISEEKKETILGRIDLLTKNSTDNWKPLRLYLEAKNATGQANIRKMQTLLKDYPSSTLIEDAIKSIRSTVVSGAEVDNETAEEVISFFREYMDHSQSRELSQRLQYEIAEIFNLRLHNYPQALLEYSRVLEADTNSELARAARGRIKILYNHGVRIR